VDSEKATMSRNQKMINRKFQVVIPALLVALLFLSASVQPQIIFGKVVGVSNGDEAQAAGNRKARNYLQ
jgi:hypothetical protein